MASHQYVPKDKRRYAATDDDRFTCLDNGFIMYSNTGEQLIRWEEIERLTAYKADLMTTDEIRIDIIFNNKQTTITEESPGWNQFIQKTKQVFLDIPLNWECEIVSPPFATNYTILYERSDRKMPEENNFYSSFINISKLRIKEELQSNGWTERKVSWHDYELRNSWTELILEGEENDPLLHGKVAFHKVNINELDEIFASLGGQYVYEFYDIHKNLILERKNAS